MSNISKISEKINTQVSASNESYITIDNTFKNNETIEDTYMVIIKDLKEKVDELVDEVNKLKNQ
jgi:division protein CdvB (Snf7/Vps24/ESCRT-III family)